MTHTSGQAKISIRRQIPNDFSASQVWMATIGLKFAEKNEVQLTDLGCIFILVGPVGGQGASGLSRFGLDASLLDDDELSELNL